jgi:prefoldin subunit 5
MTAEKIRARIAQLKAQLEALAANVNSTAGALQDCQHWLEEIEKEEAEKAKAAST